ncbi:MAG: precorrin-2 C(20)-methyltransferase [Eubacteriales bacterium]|nr:precorrin-2 C(20)-methyltransferase [Eubacteriales bacterium]
MAGILYGVGIGPGDPELLTLKAARIIREADVIAYPGKVKEDTVAYQITVQAIPEIKEKESLCIWFSMTKDPKLLQKTHDDGARKVAKALEEGKKVAFLTLGDPCVYATYIYIHKRILDMGYPAEIINGIPSFCATASRLNMGLVEKAEQLHVIPASYQIEDALKLPGVKVLMKAGKKMGEVKKLLVASGQDVVMVQNCGMPGEQIYDCAEDIPEDAGYYSLIIVKEKEI